MDFEDLFEFLLTKHINWLSYPQINVEYYLDKDNNIKKRSDEDLEKIRKDSYSSETKDYIKSLIKKIENI